LELAIGDHMNTYPYFDGVLVGSGINPLTRQVHAEAIEHEGLEALGGEQQGQKVLFQLTKIEDTQSLARSLGISAAASFSGFGFSASIETKFAENVKINRFSTYLLVSVDVQNASLVARNATLKPDAQQYLLDYGWDEFEKIYGSDYVRGYVSGGSYYGLIEILTRSHEEKVKLTARLSASGWGAKISGELEKELETITKGLEHRVMVVQKGAVGGGADQIMEVNLAEMITQAQRFPADIIRNPVPFLIITGGYRTSLLVTPPAKPDSQLLRQRNDVLEELGSKYLQYRDLRQDIQFVRDHILEFEMYQQLDTEQLSAVQDELADVFAKVTDQLSVITTRMKACREAKNELCAFPDDYYVIDPNLLPKIEGHNMILKRMEDQLSEIRQALEVKDGKITRLVVGEGKNEVDLLKLDTATPWRFRSAGGPLGSALALQSMTPKAEFKILSANNRNVPLSILASDDVDENSVQLKDTKVVGDLEVTGKISGYLNLKNIKTVHFAISDKADMNKTYTKVVSLGSRRNVIALAFLSNIRPLQPLDTLDHIRIGIVEVDGKAIVKPSTVFTNEQLLPQYSFAGVAQSITFGIFTRQKCSLGITCLVMHD
ncbi:MAG: hypothetical protein KDE09_11815, partial [Anaerolineales bacterium]|nr:hypothetical protein [Anaerolineales bacterium]